MGVWEKVITPAKPGHRCSDSLPLCVGADKDKGSIWVCECGQKWVIVKLTPIEGISRQYTVAWIKDRRLNG